MPTPRQRSRTVVVPGGQPRSIDEPLRRLAAATALGPDDVTEVTGDDNDEASLSAARVNWTTDLCSVDSWLATLRTTDATVTTLASYPVPTQSTVKVTAVIVARAVNGDSWTSELTATAKRITGNVTQVGTTASGVTQNDSGAAAWAATIDVNTASQSVRVRVTGAASTTIRWSAEVRVQETG